MKRLLTLAAMFLCSLLTFAQFSGSGSGTENDPYLILNPIHLNQLRNFLNQEGVYFKMMADVNLTDYLEDESPSQGWQPVGSSSSAAFKGILDGNGKTVSGLWINRSSNDYVGFFGYTSKATVKNLIIVANTIAGKDNVGGLTGYSNNSTFVNVSFTGKIQGISNVGGVIGGSGDNLSVTDISATVEVNASGDYVGGLIGKNDAHQNFTVSSCYVNNSKISGNNYVGGACGGNVGEYNILNSISSCYIYADVTGYERVGGICGSSESKYRTVYLNKCGFVGNVNGSTCVGGLIGYIIKTIWDSGSNRDRTQDNCFAIGSVTAIGDYSGGLIGYDQGANRYNSINSNDISNCYYSGTVFGKNCTAGLVGYKQFGTISNCYSTASVTGSKNVGGLVGHFVGYKGGYAKILTSVAINTRVTATEGEVGRIVGYNEGDIPPIGSTDENKSYNRTIVISQGVAQDIIDDQQNGTGVSATTLKLKGTYIAMGWDFNDIWEIQETECFPYMKSQTAPPIIISQVVSGATSISGKCVDSGTITLEIDGVKQQQVSSGNEFSFTVSPLQTGQEVRVSAKEDGKDQSYYATEIVTSLGSGKENDPYQVYTASDLANAYKKGYYKLMNDIDLTDYINQNSPSEGWQSIGRDGSETIHFDGDGHKITGLWCNTTRDNTGLFSCFANGSIKNLTVETATNKQVKGGSNTGILIGKMINGTIENCRVSGTVADETPVGGLVGLMDGGTITLSQASVTINTTGANSYVGGLVGEMTSGEIDQCVTLGTLTATGNTSFVGGLTGKNSATVTNCYSNASVTSSYNAAGLIAYNYSVVDKCYATGDISSKNYGAGVIGYNDGSNAVVKNCVAMNNKIDVTFESQSAQSGGYGQRIIGGIKNGAPAPELNNYALKFMQVSVNGKAQKVYDDIMNGVGKKGSDLAKGSTYQELGWNFTNIWNIVEGYSYPSLKNNAAIVLQPGEDPVEVNLTAPTAKSGLVYNGSAQELITAGSTNVGTLKYSLDDSNYSTDIPKGTDAKTYTVYYKVVDSGNKDLTTAASLTVTISSKTVSSPAIMLSATSFVYDGQEKKPTVTVKDGDTVIPSSEYTVSYSNNVNVGTATVTITDKDGGNYVVSGSTTFQITAQTATLTPPTAKTGLVYTGSAQELVNAGSSTTGEVQYSMDGSNYSTTIPKGTDAKTYTVYYKVKGDANHSDTAPASLTAIISPKTVSSPTITLSATSFVYDGQEKKPTVTVKDGNTTIPASEYTISYSNNINVGTATVTITDNEGGNYVVSGTASFTITVASANITAPTAKSGLVYNGSEQELITAGSTTAGEMQYSLDGSSYSTAIPKGTDAKTYTVYYKVKGDANHSDTEPATLTVTISSKTVNSPVIILSQTSYEYDGQEKKPTVTVKDGSTTIPASEYTVSYSNNVNVGIATVSISDNDGGNYVVSGTAQFSITSAAANVTAPMAKSGLVYNGSAQELITAGSSTAGEMQYSLDGSNYSTAIPKGTDAKTYTVYYRVKGDANHSDIAPATLVATISPKTVNNPTIILSETSFVYDGKEKKPTVTVEDGNTTIPASEYTVSYSNNINVGTATVTINDQDGGNYVVSGTTTFEIKETAINAPNAISGLVYTGYAQDLITPGYTSVGKMMYSLDNINYFTVVPAERVAKTYTVYYKVMDETETTALRATSSLNVTISKAPLKISVGDYTITEGEQIPEFELQYEGFKNYETEDVLTRKPSVSCNATANSAPGRYEITVSGAEAENYDISYVNGTLTISAVLYKLIYMVDGVVYKTYELESGASITPEPEPTKEGYTFSGWSTIPSKMPAEDVIITGTFTKDPEISEDISYEVVGGNASVTHANNVTGEIKIDESVVINGKTYQVTAIADGAFQGCTGLTSVEIPSTVTSIGQNAFNGCSGLIIIKIGKGVKEIGSKAFANIATSKVRTRAEDVKLRVYCEAEMIPSTPADAFENTPIDKAILYVPDNLVDVYKLVLPWNGFGTVVGLTTGIDSVTIESTDAFIFDMQGNRLDNVRKGVNIIRTRDGKTKKVVMK